MLKCFLDMSKHIIKKAKMQAAESQASMPIEAGKYIKKRLTDAQDVLLDVLLDVTL